MYLVSCKWVLSSNDTWCKRQDSVKENEYPETCSIPNPMERREWISSFIDFPTVSVTLCSLEPYWLPRIMIQNKGFNLFKYKFSYINAVGKNSTTLGCHMAFVMPQPQNTVHLPNWLYWSNPFQKIIWIPTLFSGDIAHLAWIQMRSEQYEERVNKALLYERRMQALANKLLWKV